MEPSALPALQDSVSKSASEMAPPFCGGAVHRAGLLPGPSKPLQAGPCSWLSGREGSGSPAVGANWRCQPTCLQPLLSPACRWPSPQRCPASAGRAPT